MDTPKGNNSLNSLGIFFQRTVYRDEVYSVDLPVPIDLWYERPLYGKINALDNSIFVSEATLKQIRSEDKKMIMTLNFVADAYEDFRQFFKRSIKQVKIDVNESQFGNIEPTTGWTNVNTIHQSYINSLYEMFRDVFVKENLREQRILDFPSFMKVFLEYIDIITPAYPFTRTTFVTTKFCPPEASGLVIQLRNQSHSQDEAKFDNFIQDKNFEFYTKVARQHGFMIDKNAPWRLVADVFSPAMKKYINKYSIAPKEVFGSYYYESYKTELDVIKVYISQIYNSYVYSEPFVKLTKQIPKTQTIVTERIERKVINPNDYDDSFWLKIYIYLRARETSTTFTQSGFDRLIRNANEVLLKLDKRKAIDYVNRHLDTRYMLSVQENSTLEDRVAKSLSRHTDFTLF